MPKMFTTVSKLNTNLTDQNTNDIKIKLLEALRDKYEGAYVSYGRLGEELRLGHKSQVKTLIEELIDEDRLAIAGRNLHGDTQYRLVEQPRPARTVQPSPVQASGPPVRYHRKEAVLAYLDAHPGATATQVAHALWGNDGQGQAASWLSQATKRGNVIARKLDGRTRYYAPNYRIPASSVTATGAPTNLTKTYLCRFPGCERRFPTKQARGAHQMWHRRKGPQTQRAAANDHDHQQAQLDQAALQSPTPFTGPNAPSDLQLGLKEVEKLAAQYVWDTGGNDLREFFRWARGQV